MAKGRDWSKADEISDRVIDLVNARIAQGIDPVSVYAGLLLGLIGYMRTSPAQFRPDSFNKVGEAAVACLHDLMGE